MALKSTTQDQGLEFLVRFGSVAAQRLETVVISDGGRNTFVKLKCVIAIAALKIGRKQADYRVPESDWYRTICQLLDANRRTDSDYIVDVCA